MFEISELKAKTLADLQIIAKSIGLSKTSQLKKLDLVYQILDTQAADPSKAAALTTEEKPKVAKPKRKRVSNTPQSSTATSEEKETTVEKIVEKPIYNRWLNKGKHASEL